jgi:two-component system, chemotaxis family, chemotaxis protein CheY
MKCLIVEDDFIGRKLMQKYLAEYGECDVATDGEEAVEAFRLALENETPYDLICLDIMMPNMNGHEALSAIRQIENKHEINGLDGVKVIMTTALGDSESVLGSFREGCEAYMIKPIRKDTLLTEIEKLGLSLAGKH